MNFKFESLVIFKHNLSSFVKCFTSFNWFKNLYNPVQLFFNKFIKNSLFFIFESNNSNILSLKIKSLWFWMFNCWTFSLINKDNSLVNLIALWINWESFKLFSSLISLLLSLFSLLLFLSLFSLLLSLLFFTSSSFLFSSLLFSLLLFSLLS